MAVGVAHVVCSRRNTLTIRAPPGAAEYRRGLSEAATAAERNPRDALIPENQPRQGRQNTYVGGANATRRERNPRSDGIQQYLGAIVCVALYVFNELCQVNSSRNSVCPQNSKTHLSFFVFSICSSSSRTLQMRWKFCLESSHQ